MADNPSAAWPVADEALAQKILDTVQQASHYRQLKKVRIIYMVVQGFIANNVVYRAPMKPPRLSIEAHPS